MIRLSFHHNTHYKNFIYYQRIIPSVYKYKLFRKFIINNFYFIHYSAYNIQLFIYSFLSYQIHIQTYTIPCIFYINLFYTPTTDNTFQRHVNLFYTTLSNPIILTTQPIHNQLNLTCKFPNLYN